MNDDVLVRLRQLSFRRADELGGVGSHGLTASAVLLLIGFVDGRPHLVLTRRAEMLRNHAGQIAFPGGRVEPGESVEEAAVREAVEEIGIRADRIEIVGRFDDAWSGRGFRIVPIVAFHDGAFSFQVDAGEVADVLVVGLDDLAQKDVTSLRSATISGIEFVDEILTVGDLEISGPTADFTIDLLEWLAGNDRRRIHGRSEDLTNYRSVADF